MYHAGLGAGYASHAVSGGRLGRPGIHLDDSLGLAADLTLGDSRSWSAQRGVEARFAAPRKHPPLRHVPITVVSGPGFPDTPLPSWKVRGSGLPRSGDLGRTA